MQSTGKGRSKIVEINTQHEIDSVLFVEHGKQLLSGGTEGKLRWWRVNDGHEIDEPIHTKVGEIYAAALSSDRKWLVCGLRLVDSGSETSRPAVWDAETHKKVLDIGGHTDTIFSVDISPDSTRFATSGYDGLVFVWGITTGENLLGPLQHDGCVVTVRFSPNGDRIATATAENPEAKSIRIYDSEDGHLLLDIPFRFKKYVTSSLSWCADGHQLFAASFGKVKRFDTTSGSLLSTWSVPGGGWSASVLLSHNQRFAVVAAFNTLSFWDTTTQQQIGTAIEHKSTIYSSAITPNDDYIATGEEDGKITIRSLNDILPASYITVNVSGQLGGVYESNTSTTFSPLILPLMHISDATFEAWVEADLSFAEQLLTEEITHSSDPFHHARALGQRALIRTRLKQWEMAIDDAEQSLRIQRSGIGYIARAIAHVHNGEHELAMRVFDLVFTVCLPTENNFLLLIKAIILFQCGKHEDAIGRVDDLTDIVDDRSQYITIQAQMLVQFGALLMRRGDRERAIELFKRAQEAVPFREGPFLTVTSLIFGWNFNRLAPAIQLHLYKAMNTEGQGDVVQSFSTMIKTLGEEAVLGNATEGWDPELVQQCLMTCEKDGDAAAKAKDFNGAIVQYTTALALNPPDPVGLFVKRSNARAMLWLWEDALKDADEAIKANTSSPWGYQSKHAALRALQRYNEAIDAYAHMHSLIEESSDEELRQLGRKYISPARSEMAINSIVQNTFKTCPLVLIDLQSGRLCDGPERMRIFKSEKEFKQLFSSITEVIDDVRIQAVVGKYFQYVTLSHVWQGKEPLFQDINLVDSAWKLESSPLNDKLRQFCETVRADGYRWAWSDTCCIDKTISTVLNQSLTMMYKWYESSAATFVHLASVASPSVLGDLTDSTWMTRAWTAQELLAAKAVRFYTRDWKPYLGDTRSNHKDSPEIMQELANAIGIARETITDFNPDSLGVREKLRLASTRHATVEEDVAYALIGIFKSDIRPHYGEGNAALGHLLEEIVARSGEVTVLAWTGKSSSYNSCLPATLAVYSRPPGSSPVIDEVEMDVHVSSLRKLVSRTDALLVHDRVTRLPPARFANRRLYLPSIIFSVKKLAVHESEEGEENHYRARASGIGHVDFRTSDRLSLTEPRRLILVHPWIRDLRDPLDSFTWGSNADDDDDDDDLESRAGSAPTSPLQVIPTARMDDYTRALRLIVRLQQPFHTLLLQQQPNGEFKRVAAEHEIVVSGLEDRINFVRDIRTDVLEIL